MTYIGHILTYMELILTYRGLKIKCSSFQMNTADSEIPDFLSIYDKNSLDEVNLLGFLIGSNLPSKITSSGNQMLVTFVSDHYRSESGFLANIHEEPMIADDQKARDCSIVNPCNPEEGLCQSDFECKGSHRCGENNCPSGYHKTTDCCYDYCGKWLDMENGTLVSPNYPNKYDNYEVCDWLITVAMTVAGPRTITLEFIKFAVSIFVGRISNK